MYSSALLLVLFLTFANCSHEGGYFATPPEGVVYNGGRPCSLPCTVELNTSLDLSAPRVSWYHRVDDAYIALSNTEFWEQRNRDYYYCQYYYYDIRRIYSQPSDFDCEAMGNDSRTVYHCSQVLDICYNGAYECRVSAISGDGEEVNVTTREIVVKYNPFFIVEPPSSVCFHPTISNLTASPQPVSDLRRLTLTWTPAEKPISVGCSLSYCPQSRRFEVKMIVFNSVPLNNETVPDYQTEWLRTKKRRQTFYVFDDFVFSPTKYYQFQVRNTRVDEIVWQYPGYSSVEYIYPRPYVDRTQIATSSLYYFGEQEKARLTEPLQDVVYTVAEWDMITVRCQGEGVPIPTLTLYHEYNGELLLHREAKELVTAVISVDQSYKFYCVARNYVLNDLGEVEQAKSSPVSITINMQGTKGE